METIAQKIADGQQQNNRQIIKELTDILNVMEKNTPLKNGVK